MEEGGGGGNRLDISPNDGGGDREVDIEDGGGGGGGKIAIDADNESDDFKLFENMSDDGGGGGGGSNEKPEELLYPIANPKFPRVNGGGGGNMTGLEEDGGEIAVPLDKDCKLENFN